MKYALKYLFLHPETNSGAQLIVFAYFFHLNNASYLRLGMK